MATFLLLCILSANVFIGVTGIKFTVVNNCKYTVWAAANPGGGMELRTNSTWTLDIPEGTRNGSFWGRTGCSFDATGRGTCVTGACGNALQCKGPGKPPVTLVEYDDRGLVLMYRLTLEKGFNVPVAFVPNNIKCCRVSCLRDLSKLCPARLQIPGGCLSACDALQEKKYCCEGGICSPSVYSEFFKRICPDAKSFAGDNSTDQIHCIVGNSYTINFCG